RHPMCDFASAMMRAGKSTLQEAVLAHRRSGALGFAEQRGDQMQALPDGYVIVAKRDCPTCELVVPVIQEIARKVPRLTVLTQDDPQFPPGISEVVDDTDLERSWHLHIETVPTILRLEGGREIGRAFGWHRGEWEALTGIAGLGRALPAER